VDWFTIEKVDNKTYVISEYKHWEQMHSYLLIGDNYALLIDTGLGIGNIRCEVEKLTKLPVKVVTTHVHWDHIGGHKHFNDIYVHEGDLKWLEEGLPIPVDFIKRDVIKDVEEFPKDFSIDDYEVYTGKPSGVLKDRDIIDIGNRKIQIVHSPGHAPGHICLYDLENNYLFTGDLIYEGTLYAFYPSTDPLKYKESVEKIMSFKDVKRILPAHNSLDIDVDIIERIYNAFVELDSKCDLKQGSGVFEFRDFKIYI